ncbi:MAG TPA: transcription termination factor NusA [Pyrinomonadaceae bacterium]|jgi:N utilization substance protein A|nr:transcription termination factor NusA [Pyrinomonadaceae bacterium]
MSASIPQSIDALCKEHGIDRELVIEAMKEAVRAAARKQFKSGEEIQVEWTPEAGLELFASKVIVEEVTNPGKELSLEEARELAGDEVEVGDELQLPMPMEEMGRIAAQTAKQILFQKVRDAVRANVYEQYIDKVGDLVNGYVKRFERGDIIVDLGTVEAILSRQQQSRGEQWAQGERIRVVINDVSKEAKGPQVEVSRTSPELLRRLFEMEVPEIYDETVVIKSAVREPGERAKIAVSSNERDVDPVGACVGMKGSRVQAIIRELRGEKIDIIEWSDEPSVFAANALSPAKVNQVRITDIERRQMEVIVNEDQLSLAIGKRGQNVRLATKLVGWNIDIRSEEEIKREVAAQMGALIASGEPVPLEALQGMNPATTAALAEHGINDIVTLANTSIDDLVEFLDISLDQAEGLISGAQAVVAASETSAQEEGEAASGAGGEAASAEADATTGDETTAAVEDDGANVEAAEAATNAAREGEPLEQHAVSAEFDPTVEAGDVEPSNAMTNEGYDEAVEGGTPFHAEEDILAADSADPVALTEAEPMSADELLLQGAGRDLRPDTITPAPDITSTEAAVLETSGATLDAERATGGDDSLFADDDEASEDDSPNSPVADLGGEASAPEVAQSSSSYESENAEESAIDTGATDATESNDDSGSAT